MRSVLKKFVRILTLTFAFSIGSSSLANPPSVGDWTEIKDASSRVLLKTAYEVISEGGSWDFIRKVKPSYSNENSFFQKMWEKIGHGMENKKVQLTGHAFWWALGTAHELANTSWNELVSKLNGQIDL